MSIQDRLLQEMKQAMRDKDTIRLGTIRLLRSQIKNVEIDQGELSDEQVEKVVIKLIKQWKDALEDYLQAGREDLVEETKQKIEILEEYMPEMMSEDELEQIVDQVVEKSGVDQVGPLIGQVMAKVGNKADGAVVAKLVRKKIG
ncbi:MAG: GatB/YqeY domain-containing protein [Candidatus Pacebacteria bacterium]|nr:GatB/YqeY domain-containing protein [Candidatus Paceibacterota bacterium]